MKLKSISSQVVRLPLDEPLANGPAYNRTHNMFVTVKLETADGIEGIGAAFFGGALSAAGNRRVIDKAVRLEQL